ncbi:hypothetical protein C1645_736664 [Glomus cerebriforme]|uniref:Ornithine decarboxylase antizyme n=1 Tax=Glomus cerebriforme TaxID=658196 RepID=A0A397T2F7_9GLOM|nr:hypothetical protein C1645_736664 [Glomus cerebriforme]
MALLVNIIILLWARRLGGVPDMTPEFLLNSFLEAGKTRYKPLDHIFRNQMKNVDRHLIILSTEKTCIWNGIITRDNTLFLKGNGFEYDSLKESIVAIIELAEEWLKVGTLVICLDKGSCNLVNLIRSFFYFGFELVAPNTYNHSNEFILVGMEF